MSANSLEVPPPPHVCAECWNKPPLLHVASGTLLVWCPHGATLAAYSPARGMWQAWSPLTQEAYENATLGALEDVRRSVAARAH